ncbi:MAG: FumA C-terminus/TtdB family hydratase beta subunit [Patescibacteria group bacterium]|jgi:tartrate/fumarate subfamily iron-sulfur-dependent hydro-lyase beta chain
MAIIHLNTNAKLSEIKQVRFGDEVLFTGSFFTARDKAHRWLLQHNFKPLHGAVLYHCGPMYEQIDKNFHILAAGPTTSARFDYYTPELLKKYQLKAIVGKGGMNVAVQEQLLHKGIYCTAIGGAAVLYAHCITKVLNVYKTEFGMTDAIWELQVKDFPVICAIDTKGNNLFKNVEVKSKQRLASLLSA